MNSELNQASGSFHTVKECTVEEERGELILNSRITTLSLFLTATAPHKIGGGRSSIQFLLEVC